jgi:hypothetical protein
LGFACSLAYVGGTLPCGRFYYENVDGFFGNSFLRLSYEYIYLYLGFVAHVTDRLERLYCNGAAWRRSLAALVFQFNAQATVSVSALPVSAETGVVEAAVAATPVPELVSDTDEEDVPMPESRVILRSEHLTYTQVSEIAHAEIAATNEALRINARRRQRRLAREAAHRAAAPAPLWVRLLQQGQERFLASILDIHGLYFQRTLVINHFLTPEMWRLTWGFL